MASISTRFFVETSTTNNIQTLFLWGHRECVANYGKLVLPHVPKEINLLVTAHKHERISISFYYTMPFTFAHPAAIIHLHRWFPRVFSSSALVIGSIIPDFEAFIFQNDRKIYGHSWPGLFWFDLPLGLVFLLIFHNAIKNPLFHALPSFCRKRLVGYLGTDWNDYFKKNIFPVTISVLLGAATHLLWDAFTHMNLLHPHGVDSGAYVKLAKNYVGLQLGSSILGLLVCSFFFLRLPPAEGRENAKTAFALPVVLFWTITTIIALAVLALAYHRLNYTASYVFFLNALMGGAILGIITASLILRRSFAKRP